jgi:hypothetical protein
MQLHRPAEPPLTVDLHGLKLAFQTPDPPLRERFEQVYGHLARAASGEADIFIGWHIHKLPTAPLPPPGIPVIAESSLVSHYGSGDLIAVRLPRYGLITVDLSSRRLTGAVTRDCLEAYGVFEDVMMISLAPLYRRRGWFPLHAFAAVAPGGQAALITGEMGSGKTTTGLALLSAGWKLLSNDSPLLRLQDGRVQVLAYPGRLSAFDDSLARFERLKPFIPVQTEPVMLNLLTPAGPQKRVFRAEEAFAEPWAVSAAAGGIFFPQVVPGLAQSELVKAAPTEALLQLMPQGIEGWDKAVVGPNLALLRHLVEQVPCYTLRLSPQVEHLPGLIRAGMTA